VYDPYQQQFDAYQRAVTEWNEGPRTEDYRGPAAPTLASQFELTAPVMPGAFDKTAPEMPFDEAKVVERQKAAAQTARRDAANRATAINVVSNPDQFGFGSLSIAERFMAEGGEVRADEDDAGVGEVGSAQALLAQLEAQAPRRAKKATPALKRMSTRSDGASMPKGMGMEQESLGSVRELVAMAKDKGSARQQMEELARLYKLKITAAQDRSRGLSASTFGAPTLEGTTLTKNTLATKRFAEGGEAKGSQAEVSEPSLLGVTRYATQASARMFPDQAGQDDQRDAARHMLAAGTVARKYGPNAAKLLGLAHEYTSNPQTFFSALGIGEPRDDLPYDVHNNRIGAELAARATSQEDLERLVKAMALQAQTQRAEGKPYIMSQEQMDARAAKAAKGPTPRPQGYQEGGEVMDPEAALFAGRDDVPAKPDMTGRELAQQALYGAGDLPYVMAGAPVDLAAMVMAPFGYKDDKPFMGSADIKARMTRAGIRPADTKEDRLKGPRVAAELLASLINPAAATRGAAMAVERGARGAGDAARKLEDATVGSVQRARIRSAADKVPPDTAYDPLRKRMEASGNLALAVRPDKIKDLMEVVRDQKGNYGARRVERAADEIPNLEELFEKDALREVFTGDNAQALITLRPADFEQYALELTKNRKSDVEPSFSGVPDKYTTTTDQYVDYLSRLQGGFKEVPYLNLYKDEVGLPVKPEVKGHEGRHRNRALAERGERTSLVQISPRGDLREGLPRRTQEEYIEALKEELERSGRLVLPERQGPSFPFRPAIKLPDVYAKGGPVDKNTAFIKAHS